MGAAAMAQQKKVAGQKTTFRCRAPEARNVRLAGSFTQWEAQAIPMKRAQDGTWTAQVTLAAGRHEYRFLVDGTWQNDPSCGACAPNPFGSANCVVQVAA